MNRKMLSIQIADELRSQIRSGKLPVNAPVMSSKQLAEHYGVSAQTANKAVVMLMEEQLLRRVQGSGTFVMENAQAIRQKCFGSGFVMPQYDPLVLRTAFEPWRDEAELSLKKLGHLTMPILFEQLIDECEGLKALEGLDGLLLPFSVAHDIRVMRTILAAKIPTVTIMHDTALPHPYHQVIPDIFHGFYQMALRLKKAGITKLVVASYGKEHPTMIPREQSLAAAALAAGYDKMDIRCAYGELSAGDTGRLCGRDLYSELPRGEMHTAVIALSDFIAFGIVDEMRRVGLQPGSDLHLLSYDDLEGSGLCPFGKPLLTSLCIPRKAIAERAAELLIERSEYRGAPETVVVSLPVNLTIRQSFHQSK